MTIKLIYRTQGLRSILKSQWEEEKILKHLCIQANCITKTISNFLPFIAALKAYNILCRKIMQYNFILLKLPKKYNYVVIVILNNFGLNNFMIARQLMPTKKFIVARAVLQLQRSQVIPQQVYYPSNGDPVPQTGVFVSFNMERVGVLIILVLY